jgi:hypothetical protein
VPRRDLFFRKLAQSDRLLDKALVILREAAVEAEPCEAALNDLGETRNLERSLFAFDDLQVPAVARRPPTQACYARGEPRRMAIDVLRDAGRPVAINKMALAASKAKGVRFPDRRTTKQTHVRLRDVFAKLEARGRGADGGAGRATWRALAGKMGTDARDS